jgi:DNA polymerase III gamma/tau subunit
LRVHHNERLHLERDALRHIADVAKGSPRRALTFLEECRHLTTLQEVQRLLALKR